MAKGKRATALFEVMSKARLQSRAAGGGDRGAGGSPASRGGIPTPKWWFKSKVKTVSEVRTYAPGQTTGALPFSDGGAAELEGADGEAGDGAADLAAGGEAGEGARPNAARVPGLTSSMDVPEVSAAIPTPRIGPVAMSVDKDRQLINFRVSYTSALIGGFGFCAMVGLAILIGKSFSRGPTTAIAGQSTQQLRQGPVTPGVLNVARGDGASGARASNSATSGGAVGGASTGTRTAPPPGGRSFNEPSPPTTFFTDDPRRQVGLNYAIIQSYPDRDTADKAADFLSKQGVSCTVEQNLPGWPLPWPNGCVVVGIRGFAKVRDNPALEAYKKSIMDASVKFASGRGRFVAFQPTMYQWKRSQ